MPLYMPTVTANCVEEVQFPLPGKRGKAKWGNRNLSLALKVMQNRSASGASFWCCPIPACLGLSPQLH